MIDDEAMQNIVNELASEQASSENSLAQPNQHAFLATDWSAHSPAVLPPRDLSINDLDGQIDMAPFPGPLESVVRTMPTRTAATNAVNLMMAQDDNDHDLPVEELYDAIASDDDDEHQPTMCAFEMERQRNIDKNNAMLHSLGLDVHQAMPPAKRTSRLVDDSDYEYETDDGL